jgi:hypothetical protein
MLLRTLITAAFALLGLLASPVSAQEVGGDAKDVNPICTFHGDGCADASSKWSWARLSPDVGIFSVELPCDKRQADSFGRLLAMSKAPFVAGSTRACMKDAAGFTSSLLGFPDLPDGTTPPNAEELLNGEPDFFSAFVKQISDGKEVAQTTISGRRAITNLVEKDDGYSKIAVIEVSRFGVLMITGDIRDGLEVSREEGEALIARFFNSLEFAE